MASLMEDLIDVLNKEEEQYQGLIELGKKKREVVIRADIKTLDEITATEQERLLQTGKEMAAINEQNEILLNQALEMVEFDLTLLKSMRQAPETANYNKNACNTGDLLGSSGFDAKQ